MSENLTTKVILAASFAAKKHVNQKRKDGYEPYINHPLEVATLLATIGQVEDVNILIAAILHDTLEDTDTAPEEIIENFGSSVYNYVLEVTDDKSLPKNERKRLQIERASNLSKGAKLIKLADKISNICDIMNKPPKNWSKEEKLNYLDWAKQVIDRLRGTNEQLESYFDKILEEAKSKIQKQYSCF